MDGATANALNTKRNAVPTAALLDPTGKVGQQYGAKTTPHKPYGCSVKYANS